ncbi:hypothetical protein OAJ72_03185 [Pelagibacteraceae bacterium]|nr:hypothetical protein [Pelagibacteraceae bacterium]
MITFDIFKNWGFPGSSKSLEEIARGSQYGTGLQNRTEQKSSSPLDARNYGYKGPMRGRLDANKGVTANQIQTKNTMPFHPSQGGTNQSLAGDQHLSWLAKLTGTNMDKAMAHWKDKGGFEGLMANPAFTMGLAFMQAGAEGKTLGQGSLDNVMKAAGISSHYKKIIEDRKQAPIQATSQDVAEVKSLLETMNIEDPSWFEKAVGTFKGENRQAMFDMAAEDVANALEIEMAALQKANKSSTPLVFDTRRKLKIIKRLIREGKIKKVGGIKFLTSATLRTDQPIKTSGNLARGGPVTKGKAYVVGEEGPEVIIPHSSGNVLSTDDSQIFAMLLAANPQLQKVSKARAEKIMRARFPEYFE